MYFFPFSRWSSPPSLAFFKPSRNAVETSSVSLVEAWIVVGILSSSTQLPQLSLPVAQDLLWSSLLLCWEGFSDSPNAHKGRRMIPQSALIFILMSLRQVKGMKVRPNKWKGWIPKRAYECGIIMFSSIEDFPRHLRQVLYTTIVIARLPSSRRGSIVPCYLRSFSRARFIINPYRRLGNTLCDVR